MRQFRETTYTKLEGRVEAMSAKAVLIDFGHNQVWVPKSQIKHAVDRDTTNFEIADWLIEKNNLAPVDHDPGEPLTDSYDRFEQEDRSYQSRDPYAGRGDDDIPF